MQKSVYMLDAYKTSLNTTITAVFHSEDRYHVQLDQTPFYPEGGGQPSDIGLINGISVEYVYEKDHEIFHVLSKPINVGESVLCHIDWDRRFDHMQQHSGQHVLSSVMDHLYNAATVGFRMTNEYVTIDLNHKLSPEEILNAEMEANRLIWSNLAFKCYWPDASTLASLPLRKKPSVEDSIRIVEIDQYDYSPCCGTHVNQTGEIGSLKISKFENHKTGVRIEFHCGKRALKRFELLRQITQTLCTDMSAIPENLLETYEKQRQERKELKDALQDAQKNLLSYYAEKKLSKAHIEGSTHIVNSIETRDMKELKELGQLICQTPETVAILGTIVDNKASILLQRSADLEQLNMKAIFGMVSPLINGRGGGNALAAQGGGDAAHQLESCITEAQKLIIEQLHGNTAL